MVAARRPDEDVNNDVNSAWKEAQVDGRCARSGCDESPVEGRDYCDEHHEDQLRRCRESMARRRERWEADKLCTRCGKVRHQGRVWCFGCLQSLGRIDLSDVNNDVNKRERVAARLIPWSNSPTNEGRTRLRGGKRGAPSKRSLDETDLRYATNDFKAAVEGLAYAETDVVKAQPKVQRDDVRAAAVAKLVSAARWIVDVAKRNGWEGPGFVIEEDDDE